MVRLFVVLLVLSGPSFAITKWQAFGIGASAGAVFHVPITGGVKLAAKAVRHPKKAAKQTGRGLKRIKP